MSDQLKIKSFIIYLEQNSSRFANAYSLFTNMPNSHIYPAIDKRTINFVKEKADSDRIFILYGNKIFPHNPTKRTLKLSHGEAACLLSHYFIWKHLQHTLDENELALILEDDAICLDKEKFFETIQHLPELKSFDLCELFTSFNCGVKTKINDYFYVPNNSGFNRASSYILTKSGVHKILSKINSLDLPADDILSNLTKDDTLRTIFPYHTQWNLNTQIAESSSIWGTESHLAVKWDRPINIQWIGAKIGSWTGIGNQMFQYAALKILSILKGVRLVICPTHMYALDNFNYINHWQEKVPDKYLESGQLWIEKTPSYDSSLFDIDTEKTSYNINGYLQSILYMKNFTHLLDVIFDFNKETTEKCAKILTTLTTKNQTLIAVHIRLPDIKGEPIETFTYCIPTPSYLYNSMEYYTKKYSDCNFIICSNDIERAKTIYDFNHYTTSYINIGIIEDMCLMHLCHHFILSSSSYSYWSAILCKHKSKEIIMSTPLLNPKKSQPFLDHHIALDSWKIYDLLSDSFV